MLSRSPSPTAGYFKRAEILNCESSLRDLHLMLQDDDVAAVETFIAVPGKTDSKRPIREDMSIGSNDGNVLHFACLRYAPQIVRLLTNPPFSWSPDRLTDLFWTPMQIAVDFYDFASVYEMAAKSEELRPIVDQVPDWHDGGNPCNCLVWPQDFKVKPFCWDAFPAEHKIGAIRIHHAYTEDLRDNIEFPGALNALLLELYMATPFLFNFQLWTGEQDEPKNNRFWPMSLSVSVDPISNGEHKDCSYPDSLATFHEMGNKKMAYQKMLDKWLVHQCYCRKSNAWKPLMLKVLCRAVIRCFIVKATPFDKPNGNYMAKVKTLGLPTELELYLVYREFWLSRYWKILTSLKRHYGINYKYHMCKPMELTSGESGYLLGHSFIPGKHAVELK